MGDTAELPTETYPDDVHPIRIPKGHKVEIQEQQGNGLIRGTRVSLDELDRLRARQREEGDVDTRTIGLALNDIRSIVRQDWTWTTELQRHYDLAMDALRPEPPTEQEQDDGPVDMDRVIEIARYNAANDVGVGPSYVSHLLAYIDDLEADATPQREGEREPDVPIREARWVTRDLQSIVDRYAKTCETSRESQLLESFNRELDRLKRYLRATPNTEGNDA